MDGTTVRHINPRLLHILEKLDDTSFRFTKLWEWIFHRRAKGPIVSDNEEAEYKKQKKPKLIVHRAIHKFRRKSVEQIVEPCPGVVSVLSLLNDHNIPVAIVSNGLGKGYGHDILSQFDLKKFFKVSVFREDIHKSKPNPESFMLALERMDITPKPDDVIWVIGDRHKDMLAAIALSNLIEARVFPIAYSFNSAVAILEKGLNPELIIMSYFDMQGRLSRGFGKKSYDV